MQYSIQRSAVGIQPNLFTAKDAKERNLIVIFVLFASLIYEIEK